MHNYEEEKILVKILSEDYVIQDWMEEMSRTAKEDNRVIKIASLHRIKENSRIEEVTSGILNQKGMYETMQMK